jgi:hypothetical protein
MERWREHLREINSAIESRDKQQAFCKKQVFYEHFYRGNCRSENLKFFILEVCEQTDTVYRETREDFFIRLFNSAYPFGLNQKIKNFGSIHNNNNNLRLASHPYYNLQIARKQRSHGCRRILGQHKRSMQKPDLNFINWYLTSNEKDKRNINYSNLSLKTMKHLNERISRMDPFKIFLECKIHEIKNKHNFNSSEGRDVFMIYEFAHKSFDRIGIGKLFNNSIKSYFAESKPESIPKICITYSYKPKISTYIHNQNRFCRNLSREQIIQAYCNINCCDHIPNEFKKDGHLATGNLEFCPKEINEALKYGNNFRYSQNLRLNEINDSLFMYFDRNVAQLSRALRCNT